MALPSFASIDDYTERFGAVESEERAEAALSDASTDIRAELGRSFVDTDGNIDFTGATAWAEDVFRKVTCQVAQRRLANPGGLTAERFSIDNYSAETSLSNESADSFLKRSEISALRRAAGLAANGLGIITTTRSDSSLPDTLPVAGSDKPMPWTYEPLLPS